MAIKTIDLLLNLEADKGPSIDQLKKDFEYLDKRAIQLRKDLDKALKNGDTNAKALGAELRHVEGLIGQIDDEARKQNLAKSLKAAEAQANRTRERMEKLAQVGMRMASAGALIAAPMILAFKKYIDMAKEDDPLANRFREIGTQLTDIQVRFGKIVAEQILPTIEKVMPYLDRAITFLEANPGLVKSALLLAGGLVVAGGTLSTVATVIGTLANIKGLLAGAGVAGEVLTTTGITTAITGAVPAIGAALLAVMTSPLTWAVAALALTVPIMNWLLGTNQTWADIAATGHKALIIIGYGIDRLLKGIGGFFVGLGKSIYDGLYKLGAWIVGGIQKLVSIVPGRANGGYAGTGIYKLGEKKRPEFVMNDRTTKAAEGVIGGSLTQDRLLSALAGGGRRITYNDSRRIDSKLSSSDRRAISNDAISALAGAI